MEGLSLAEQLEQEQLTTMSLHKRLCEAFDKLDRQQERLESEENLVSTLQEELKAAKSTQVLNELWKRVQNGNAALNAALKEQVQQQLRAAQTDSVLAEVREQLKSEKAARAAASREFQEALQRQAAEIETAKKQLAGAASQQSLLHQELKRAQQQSMTASADNATLNTQLQAMQEQLANATAVIDAQRAQLQAAEQHSQAWTDEKCQLQNTINAQAQKVSTLTNLNLAFRSDVEKAHSQRRSDVAKLEGVNSQLQSQIRELQKTANCMPKPRQADKEGKAAQQHNDQGAVAGGHRTAAKTGPAAASKSHMRLACKQSTTTEAAGSTQQGKVAAKPAADQASSGRAGTSSKAPQGASGRRKATQPVATKASSAQPVRPSTAGGTVKSAAARIAAILPANNAAGCQVKAASSCPSTKHEQGSRDAVKQAEHAKPAHAIVTHNLTDTKRKRVDSAGSSKDDCNTARRQKTQDLVQEVANTKHDRQSSSVIKAWK